MTYGSLIVEGEGRVQDDGGQQHVEEQGGRELGEGVLRLKWDKNYVTLHVWLLESKRLTILNFKNPINKLWKIFFFFEKEEEKIEKMKNNLLTWSFSSMKSSKIT